MKFVAPALLLLFSLSFAGAWTLERTRRYLLLFAIAFLCFGLAAAGQIAIWPRDVGANKLITVILFCVGVLLLCEGVLQRSGRHLALPLPLFVAGLIVAGIFYFFYIDRSLVTRAYILHFGLGTLFLITAWQGRFLRHGRGADRALWWLVVVVGLHFFPRTILTTGVFIDGAFGAATFWNWVQITFSLVGAIIALGLMAVTAIDVVTALRGERDSDPLTGLLNRRGLDLHSRAARKAHHKPVSSIVVCDIDHFKVINDTYGHAVGDAVLEGFAGTIRDMTRAGDLVARIGGEEFVVVLRGTPPMGAYQFAERLRLDIQRARFSGLPRQQTVTCSFGVVEFREGDDLWAAVDRADEYLYAAKKAGRNRTFAEGLQKVGVA
ncbi:diguanylate cyclase (GGDEF)-like protein [Mesorhizobium soli]|uniref:GGDEF domain-containing protein n=1 Tax=Pseudaminobacter soli (ex Li et al. 2025) TaxID=1295366 RepID=UPI00247481A6|nr:GGDEF domain-containing protein [Mesorhizobium soli]MDH6230919.1 diguanylate cyclase (GGDEF)-like protein [Mesorhizobium soli]